MSFGIRDSDFMMLEDSTINFLHGCWNYYFIKTDIDVMMLFKFDIKYVKLNFMAIASKEFPSINRMFLFNQSNGNQESIKSTWDFVINLFNFWPIENSFRLIFLYDRSNRNRELIESSRMFIKIFFIISINWGIHLINRKLWILNFH